MDPTESDAIFLSTKYHRGAPFAKDATRMLSYAALGHAIKHMDEFLFHVHMQDRRRPWLRAAMIDKVKDMQGRIGSNDPERGIATGSILARIVREVRDLEPMEMGEWEMVKEEGLVAGLTRKVKERLEERKEEREKKERGRSSR